MTGKELDDVEETVLNMMTSEDRRNILLTREFNNINYIIKDEFWKKIYCNKNINSCKNEFKEFISMLNSSL